MKFINFLMAMGLSMFAVGCSKKSNTSETSAASSSPIRWSHLGDVRSRSECINLVDKYEIYTNWSYGPGTACYGGYRDQPRPPAPKNMYYFYPYVREGADMQSCIRSAKEISGLWDCRQYAGLRIIECAANRVMPFSEANLIDARLDQLSCAYFSEGPRNKRTPIQ